MLSNSMVYPSLPAVDLKRARKFYEEKLGLKVVAEDKSPGIMFQAGQNSYLYLYQRGATKADHTVAAFMVDNVESEVMNLKNKGVKFEDYNIPNMKIKTVNGIATMEGMKGAWFKDTEGNILSLGELTDAKMKEMMGMKMGAGAMS
jgi:catechol 2,3-dioxygenase-like lactoylglutathione lyase family enzyme